jgi:sirohydrochlorin cobaltochelatase
MKSAYLVIAHGSRDKEANDAFSEFLNQLRQAFPKRHVQGAFLELCKPSIPEAIASCIAEGMTQIFILPLMFFPGRHVKKDIPAFIEEAKARHPDVDFHYSGPLASDSRMLKLVAEKAQELSLKGK